MELQVPADVGRGAFAESVEAFVRAASAVDEHALLGASRCHGWTRLDVVVHVLAGWQEVLGGLCSPVDDVPTVDAASYWQVAAASAHEDLVDVLMAQHRRTAAYARPSSALVQLRDVARAVLRGAEAARVETHVWQGEVFGLGDFLATWAVEDAVHHLDLLVDEPPPASALALARASVEALVGAPLPASMTDAEVALVGAGRVPAPDGLGVPRLPVLR